jgi:hypothetical protein
MVLVYARDRIGQWFGEVQARDEARGLPRPHGILVEELPNVDFEGVISWSLAVSGDKRITVTGPVEVAEPDSAFKDPQA